MTINLMLLQPEHVSSWWPTIEHYIADIVSTMRGKYTIDDMFTCAALNKIQLWLGLDKLEVKALGITLINDFPSTRLCQFIAMTGTERESWEHWMVEIEKWAKYNGCKDMELICRPGWERSMKKFNYEKTHIVLNKFLEE